MSAGLHIDRHVAQVGGDRWLAVVELYKWDNDRRAFRVHPRRVEHDDETTDVGATRCGLLRLERKDASDLVEPTAAFVFKRYLGRLLTEDAAMLNRAFAQILVGRTGKARWRRDRPPDDPDLARSFDLELHDELALVPGRGRRAQCDSVARESRRKCGGVDAAPREIERDAPLMWSLVHAQLGCVCRDRERRERDHVDSADGRMARVHRAPPHRGRSQLGRSDHDGRRQAVLQRRHIRVCEEL